MTRIPQHNLTHPSRWALPLGAATVGALVLLAATQNFGTGLSPDSISYIAAANSLLAGSGLRAFDGTPFIAQPPLYPLILATVMRLTGIAATTAATLLNPLFFSMMLFATGRLLMCTLRSARLAGSGIVSLLVAVPLVHVSLMAWSEPLFILLSLYVLAALAHYHRVCSTGDVPRARRALLHLTLLSALACLTRYIGVTLVALGVIVITASSRQPWPITLREALGYALGSLAPLLGWLLRNQFVAGTLTGDRATSAYTLADNLRLTWETVISWGVPEALRIPGWLVASAVFVFVVALSSWLLRGKRTSDGWILGVVAFLFAFIYLCALIVLSTRIAYDQIDSRLLAPLFIPLLLGTLVLLDSVAVRRGVASVVAALLLLMLVTPAGKVATMLQQSRAQGQGYSAARWVGSDTLQSLRGRSPDCTLYTNVPYAVVGLTAHPAKWSPARTRYHSTEIVNDIATLGSTWPAEENACLVWLDDGGGGHLFTLEQLRTAVKLDLIASFDDGAIHRISRLQR